MMKKLLVLMLVFSMVSTAGAALTLVVATGDTPGSGDYTDVGDVYPVNLFPSDTIWIGVYNDTQGNSSNPQQFQAYMEFDSSATNPPAEFTQNGLVYKPPAVEGAPDITFYGYTATYAVDWLYAEMTDGNPDHYTGVGTVFGVEFHCLRGINDVEVRLMDVDYQEIDSILIHQIPEPMTIALLGLGGLFLRRRGK